MGGIRLDGLSKRYGGDGGVDAVSDLSLDIEDGEFFTLLGPSGCGKTTILRTIAGFEAPTEGTVSFGRETMDGVPPEERDIGIVFQNYALFPHMSVAENVAYGLRFRDPPGGGSEQRVEELLDLVDLGGMGGRDPEQLSGGQQQRVALARALAPGPRLLLLDEPLSALDARLRTDLRAQIRRIQSDLGVTTVYVTHDQAEALAISDRIAVLRDGRVEQIDTPRGIYRNPTTPFVASFIGENNVFDARVRESGAESTRLEIEGESITGPPLETAAESVLCCVRPEAFSMDGGENRLDVAVESWEFLGESVRVHCRWLGRELVVRTSDVPHSETLTVGFDPEDVHAIETR
ncbi:ABC transporter ATP-binding protein [Halalkalicoccus subterraneus]|uniref:ABC transporter ATP-binding protein n=1 Tax=Halalkalicoccus subterraneus TaxID=2675002 RepID=UPI000EFBD65B|nr:ABC transporter ATP-binding protein [Halalkalicoccus subterraneus]